MIDKIEECWGSLRITNINTLKRWLQTGKFQELIDEGYQYASGCGRFREDPCTCYKCRKNPRPSFDKVIEEFYKTEEDVLNTTREKGN